MTASTVRDRALEEASAPELDREREHPDALTYWQRRDRWTALGREIGDRKAEAKRRGLPVEALPGVARMVDEFKALGRELDRRVR